VGDGSHRKELEALAHNLGVAGHVVFAGPIAYDKIADAYVGTSLIINPRLRPTAYDHALIIGMATGIPVITTDIGDVEFVATGGEHAIVVPVGDAKALAAAMIASLTNTAVSKRIGRAGRQRIESRFTMEQTIAAYSELVRSLAGHGHVPEPQAPG
jgi:glycosyltransferase involved in cell wall biosynthesis